MKLVYKIVFIAFISSYLHGLDIGNVLLDIKAKQDNLIIKKGNEEITYFTKKKEKIRTKKVYKGKYLVKITNYSYDTSFKVDEYEFIYDYNQSKPTNKYTEKISRYYNTQGYLIEESKSRVVSRRFVQIYAKTYNDNGKLHSVYINKNAKNKGSSYTLYDDFGNIAIKETLNDKEKYLAVYENGILIKEGIYKPDKSDNIPKDTITTYKYNGTLKSEHFYKDGRYISKSLCSFKTDSFIKKLEREYKVEDSFNRLDNSCKKIGKSDLYVMMIPYFNYEKDYTQVMLSIIDTKVKKIKGNFFGKNSRFNHASAHIELDDASFLSQIDTKVFDVVFYRATNSRAKIQYLNTYKITDNNKLIKLKKPSFKLSDILQRAKDGEDFDASMIDAMVNEIPIDKANVEQYEQLALSLQKHNFHNSAIALFPKIFRVFPNRADTILHSAKSWSVVEGEYAAIRTYQLYAELMKKQNKQIPKWIQDILDEDKKNHLKDLNIKHEIIKIDNTHSQAVFAIADDKTIRVNFDSSIDVKKRIILKDIDFDDRPELLVDVRTQKDKEEYKVFQLEYYNMIPYKFNDAKTLKRFELNKRDEKLIEYRDKTVDTYCKDSDNRTYYLCEQEKR